MFHQISKHLEVIQKISAVPRFFNLLLSVWISDETHLLVFDILLEQDNQPGLQGEVWVVVGIPH